MPTTVYPVSTYGESPPSQVKHATFLEESDNLGPNPNPVTF